MKYLQFIFFLFCCIFSVYSQKSIDKIVAVVGDEIILESDVENQYNYLINNGTKDKGDLRCQAVDAMIINKILLTKAKQDSIAVKEDEVDAEVDKRVNAMIENVDGVANFEKIVGRNVMKYKNEIHSSIEDEMLIDRQKSKVLSSSEVTPKEVKDFFITVPKDSFGILPAEVEINHIVAVPPFSEESKKAAREKLEDLRKQVLEKGKDFTELAKKYSEEPGASKSGGDLGEFGRGMMVPEFEAMAYSMRPGEISKVIQTEFGYHIIKLLDRRGEIVHAQHILIIPDRDVKGDSTAISKLKKALAYVRKDSLTFEEAAIRFSQERDSKDCGGCIQNPKTGELRIPLQQLDTEFFFKIDNMKEGEVSEPMEYTMRDGTKAFHVIYLKRKIPPHKPNMKDDYKKIYNIAVQYKQSETFDRWLVKARKNVYLDVKPSSCKDIEKKWKQ